MSTLFELAEFKPFQDRWNTRLMELSRRERYYDGTAYRKSAMSLGWLIGLSRVYQNIKPLYLPLSRAVDIDAGIVPGAWELAEDMPDNIVIARDTVFDWSQWSTDGVLYVHYGAVFGVSGLKVADLREQGRVVIKPVDPTCFLLVENGQYSNEPKMSLQIEHKVDETGEPFEYAEVITAEAIRTFKDGQPFGYDERQPEYTNELGFVPFVEVDHIRTGKELGESTFLKTIPLLNEVNELASYLADIVKRHAEPQWAILGAEERDLEKSGDNVWFFDRPDAKVQALLPPLDIPGILEFVREIRDQVHGSLPELAFDELRKKDQIATATLELQLMELVLKVKRCRPNYDSGLVTALQMAGMAAATLGLTDISVLATDDLALNDERPVIPLDPETAIRIELQAIALEREKGMNTDA